MQVRHRRVMETDTGPVGTERGMLEREPITEGKRGRCRRGAEISEEEHDAALREEREVIEETIEERAVRERGWIARPRCESDAHRR